MASDLKSMLLDIRKDHGKLTPKVVVDVARDPEHPLHTRFTWDDSVAGEKWRRHEASELIRSVRVTYRSNSGAGDLREVRGWHSVVRADEPVYEPVEDIVSDPMAMHLVLAAMKREWLTFKRKYEHLKEFREIILGDLNDPAA